MSQSGSPASSGTGQKKRITGIIQVTRKGVGYLAWPLAEGVVAIKGAPKEKEDIEIDTQNLNGALNGDEVEVELKGLVPQRVFRGQAPKPARMMGQVAKVVARAKQEFVCTIKNGVAFE